MSDLHPEAQKVLTLREQQNTLPEHSLALEEERARLEQNSKSEDEPPPVGRVRTVGIPGPGGELPVRIYEPEDDGPHPIVVFFHGGGFRSGSIETHDALCRILAREAQAVVLGVDYRLAPEHPFPAGLRDCYTTLEWAEKYADRIGGDSDRIALAGDSAGGNLAAATALLARNRNGPSIAHQLLLYPMIDYNTDEAKYHHHPGKSLLEPPTIVRAWEDYLQDDIAGANPYASPSKARDLSGVAPARVVTCEFDPLFDEGRAYADRLASAGTLLDHHDLGGVFHGHLQLVQFMTRAREDAIDIASRLGNDLD